MYNYVITYTVTMFAMLFAGSYIFIEASSPRVEGDKAIIEAGPFQADQNYCFKFHYHMYGKHIGRLSVYLTWANETNLQLLWSENTSNVGQWQEASLNVRSIKQFNVRMQCGELVKLISRHRQSNCEISPIEYRA